MLNFKTSHGNIIAKTFQEVIVKKLTAIFVLLGVMFTTNLALAYNSLRVGDPRTSWSTYRGTIEEAIVSVRPQGIYMEIGLYLTFSARGTYFDANDSLEVTFFFDLPQDAIVHDSWLWVGDDIIRGLIMDKWTAASIYEDIVKRRRDPSILYKRGQGRYELRIFPMAGNETRKVKLTYLVPTHWTTNSVTTPLPTELLRTSRYQLSEFYLLTWINGEWKNPGILEFPEIEFISQYREKFGNYYRADLPTDAIQTGVHFAVDSPLKDGVYMNRFGDGNEGLYQLTILPSQALDVSVSHKVALLFDYDVSKSNISETVILNNVKSMLHANFAPKDSFNLIFSQLNINRASEVWLPADSSVIESTFESLGENPIASYSNLPSLLANGIDFVKQNSNDGSLMLISNSDQVGAYQVANQLIDDLMDLMDPALPIHIADFTNQNYQYNYIGGRYYRGNEYFYTNMSRLTAANYLNLFSGNSFSEMLTSVFQSMSGFISSFDLHTSMDNGFCFSRFSFNNTGQSIYLNRPILQVGKYFGTLPFKIEASGIYGSNPFSETFLIQENDIFLADTLAEEIWVGNYIKALETEEQTNDIVAEIIDNSIDHRVLSLYSAFLCLEPSDKIKPCYDCLDESEIISFVNEAPDSSASDSLLQAYPNPFNAETTIHIKMKQTINPRDVSFTIYNIMGQIVRTFEAESAAVRNEFKFHWNGANDAGQMVSSGNYFFVVTTPTQRSTLKLLFMK